MRVCAAKSSRCGQLRPSGGFAGKRRTRRVAAVVEQRSPQCVEADVDTVRCEPTERAARCGESTSANRRRTFVDGLGLCSRRLRTRRRALPGRDGSSREIPDFDPDRLARAPASSQDSQLRDLSQLGSSAPSRAFRPLRHPRCARSLRRPRGRGCRPAMSSRPLPPRASPSDRLPRLRASLWQPRSAPWRLRSRVRPRCTKMATDRPSDGALALTDRV